MELIKILHIFPCMRACLPSYLLTYIIYTCSDTHRQATLCTLCMLTDFQIDEVTIITANMTNDRKLLVLYGSQTGTAQDVAETLARDGRRCHFNTRVMDMDSYKLVRKCVFGVWYCLHKIINNILKCVINVFRNNT